MVIISGLIFIIIGIGAVLLDNSTQLAPIQNTVAPATIEVIDKPGVFAHPDLRFGPVNMEMAREEVLRLLGKPVKSNVAMDEETLEYPDGTTVILWRGKVSFIKVSTDRFPTVRGLKTGDPEAEILRLYGPPHHILDGVWIYKYDNEEYDTFFVTVKSGIVTAIAIKLEM